MKSIWLANNIIMNWFSIENWYFVKTETVLEWNEEWNHWRTKQFYKTIKRYFKINKDWLLEEFSK